MNKIKKGDEVIIMTGKDKGRRGQVLKVFRSSKILVENINLVKKHQKGNPNTGQESGIIEKELISFPKCFAAAIIDDESRPPLNRYAIFTSALV